MFVVVLATDGDVTQQEIGQVLDDLGYHGVFVLAVNEKGHECPCPSGHCTDLLRRAGHFVPKDTMCCDCWVFDTLQARR